MMVFAKTPCAQTEGHLRDALLHSAKDVAGMIAGADCIDDLDVLRHGGMGELFGGIRRPRRWGRSCAGSPGATCASSRRFPGGCSPSSPPRPRYWPTRRGGRIWTSTRPSAASTVTPRWVPGSGGEGRRVHAAAAGLNPLLAAVSTPTWRRCWSGPGCARGTANSARGAESFVAESITTSRAAGATGLLIARMDSAFYNGAAIAAAFRPVSCVVSLFVRRFGPAGSCLDVLISRCSAPSGRTRPWSRRARSP